MAFRESNLIVDFGNKAATITFFDKGGTNAFVNFNQVKFSEDPYRSEEDTKRHVRQEARRLLEELLTVLRN